MKIHPNGGADQALPRNLRAEIGEPMDGRQGYFRISASRGWNDWLKDTSSDTASAIKTAEIILLRPRPDHPQRSLAPYTSCQVEAELPSGL